MDVRPIMPRPVAGDAMWGAAIRLASADSARILGAIMDTPADLSQSDADQLIRILEVSGQPRQDSEVQDYLRGAVLAAQKGDPGAALKQLEMLIQLDPARADSVRTEPLLEPIRAQVNQLVTRLESMAGPDAQTALAEAAKVLESRGRQPLPGWDMGPRILLTAANRLYAAGGYVNYLRASALAAVVIEGARPPTADSTPDNAAVIDTAAPLQLSPPDADKLVRILEPPALPLPSTSGDLLRTAVSAAQADPGSALEHLAELVGIDPNRVNTLRTEPGLAPIRAQVDQMLVRLESMAGLKAQTQLGWATRALESWGRQSLPGWDAPPQTLLTVASRLYDAGGYVNYLHAASIAEVVVEGAHAAAAEPANVMAAIVRLAASLQLSPSDTERVIHILDPPGLPRERPDSPDLLRSAVAAAQKGDPDGALKHLEDLVRLDPNRAHTLRMEPGLEPVRANVDQMLARLDSTAKTDAHARLAEAAKVLESWGRQPLHGWDAAPLTVLTAASRLYDGGGYVNYMYAAFLAQVVIEGVRVPIAVNRKRLADSPRKSVPASVFGRRLKALWARAPLLVLLVSWFFLGLAAMGVAAILHYFWPGQYPASLMDNGFALWGIGFLALVVFGFYMRIRHVRFR